MMKLRDRLEPTLVVAFDGAGDLIWRKPGPALPYLGKVGRARHREWARIVSERPIGYDLALTHALAGANWLAIPMGGI